jgi:hypothetical protein
MKFGTITVLAFVLLSSSVYASALYVNLGTADTFAVLAGSSVTVTGPTVVDGNVGVARGGAITGFPPGTITVPYAMYAGTPVASQAESDLTSAYNFATGEPCPGANVLSGQNLGGLTLNPGVYCFGSAAQLNGTLTLDAMGDPNAIFLFQIGSTLTTASNAAVIVIDGGQPGDVFWQVGSSATIGTSTAFEGNILAFASITLNNGANIESGSALARSGAVIMNNNDVSLGCELSAGVCG